MTLIVKYVKRQFEIPDEGTHLATLVEIQRLGPVQTAYGVRNKLLSVFETDQLDREGKPRRAFKRFTETLHPKSALRKAIRSIIGEDPGDEFDLARLIGRTVQIVIEHQESEGSAYANITAIMRVKSTEPPAAGTPVVHTSGPKLPRPKNSSGSAEALPDDIPEPDETATAVATPNKIVANGLALE